MDEEHTPEAANNFVIHVIYWSGGSMFIFIAFVFLFYFIFKYFCVLVLWCPICLFVWMKPEKLYSASCGGRVVNPLLFLFFGLKPEKLYFASCSLGLFVWLFVGLKPDKPYSASCWEGSKPPGSGHTRAEAQKLRRAYQRQRHKPRTCQFMVNTLQVDGLARITGLT